MFGRIVVIITTVKVKIEQYIRERALDLGFGAVGFARVDASQSFPVFQQWVAKGYCAEMHYLVHHAALRADPRTLAPDARTIIVVAARYPFEDENCLVSNYARGADYHDVIRAKLQQLAAALEEKHGAAISSRICVDTAPLLEREWAVRAGIGWIGKQGSVVSPDLGTCFFLGELLVNIALEPSVPQTERCGECRLCVAACPAKAILPGNQLDARRCVSYLTIEHKKDLNREMAALMRYSVFGCDKCTVVCPWNRKGRATVMSEFNVPAAKLPSLEECLALDQKRFKKHFGGTPIAYIGLERLKRNVSIVMINKKSEFRSQ